MAINVCPVCCELYEGSNDHPRDPCRPCWELGYRVDACGNLWRVNGTAELFNRKRRSQCGCVETYPQLVPGKVSHGPGCPHRAEG